MCLYIDKEIHGSFYKIKKAKKDIVCYKVLKERKGKLCTPYAFYEVSPQVVKGELPMIGERSNILKFFRRIFHSNIIGEGYIHTFRLLIYAQSDARGMTSFMTKPVIFKCIIPKGTYYYQGDGGDYASEHIIFKECLTIPSPI